MNGKKLRNMTFCFMEGDLYAIILLWLCMVGRRSPQTKPMEEPMAGSVVFLKIAWRICSLQTAKNAVRLDQVGKLAFTCEIVSNWLLVAEMKVKVLA